MYFILVGFRTRLVSFAQQVKQKASSPGLDA